MYRQAVEGQTTVEFEEHYAPPGIWVDVRAYPSATGLSVFFRDITAKKRADEALRRSEERYRLLADMIPKHIWTTDARGYHNYFSRRWYEFTGMTPAQTEGEGWLHLLHPEDRERTVARWQHS
jgi:PAS domain-containing protein